jgi:hypothetical protein
MAAVLGYVLLGIAALWLLWVYVTIRPSLTQQKATGLGALGLPSALIVRCVPPDRLPKVMVFVGLFVTIGWLLPLAAGLLLLFW